MYIKIGWGFLRFLFLILKIIYFYFFIWLYQVLVAALGIFDRHERHAGHLAVACRT